MFQYPYELNCLEFQITPTEHRNLKGYTCHILTKKIDLSYNNQQNIQQSNKSPGSKMS